MCVHGELEAEQGRGRGVRGGRGVGVDLHAGRGDGIYGTLWASTLALAGVIKPAICMHA